LKFTKYFEFVRQRPNRAVIRDEWIERVVKSPVREIVQQDGRIRRWAPIDPLPFLLLPVFVAYMNRFQISPEERALSAKFGDEYDAYKQDVRRWL